MEGEAGETSLPLEKEDKHLPKHGRALRSSVGFGYLRCATLILSMLGFCGDYFLEKGGEKVFLDVAKQAVLRARTGHRRGGDRGGVAQAGWPRQGQRGAHRAPAGPKRSRAAAPQKGTPQNSSCSSAHLFILFPGNHGCERAMWGHIPFFSIPWVRRCGFGPALRALSAAGEEAHGARAGAFPEIAPLQESSSARDLPPARPLPPPSSLPTHTQPSPAHATRQPRAQLRFKRQQSHQNGFVWRKVYKKPGLPDARYWSVPSVSFVYRP